MIRVTNVDEFARKNEGDLWRYMTYKTGIRDADIIQDTVQEFYVKLIETRALDTYDPSRGTFKTYIMTLFSWLFPVLANRNPRAKHTLVSRVRESGRGSTADKDATIDVYERTAVVGESPYIDNVVDPPYAASHVCLNDDIHADIELGDFMRFVRRTRTEKSASRIRSYLIHRRSGCNGADVARILGVSNNMVKMIKKQTRESYEEWRGKTMKSAQKRSRSLTRDEIADEIRDVQGQIDRFNKGDMSLPQGFVYRDALVRLKYLRNRQIQIAKKDKKECDADHSADPEIKS